MKQPILSICIPTYNRDFFLKRLLDGLLPQIKAANGKVNLYISDNASNDGTQVLCQSYLDNGFCVNYIRNDENTGPDANIGQAFSLGDGQYVWVLGDDEYIYKDSLARILELITSDNFSIVYLKSEVFKSGFESISNKDIAVKRFNSNLAFSNAVGVYFTFISGVIVNKNILNNIEPKFSYKNGLDTFLVQLSWVFTLLNSHGNFVMTKTVLLAAEGNESVDYKIFTVFGTNLKKMIDRYLCNNKKIESSILISAMWFLSVYFHKNKDKFNSDNSLEVMDSAFSKLQVYVFFVRPIMMLNKNLSSFLLKVLYRIFR